MEVSLTVLNTGAFEEWDGQQPHIYSLFYFRTRHYNSTIQRSRVDWSIMLGFGYKQGTRDEKNVFL